MENRTDHAKRTISPPWAALEGVPSAIGRYALDEAPWPVLVVRDGIIVDAGRPALELFGLGHDGLCGRPLADTVLPDCSERLRSAVKYAPSDVDGPPQRIGFIAARGKPVTAHVRVSALATPGAASCVIFIDPSPQATDRPNGRADRLFIARAVNADSHALLTLDSDGNILSMNDRLLDITGGSLEDALGRPWVESFVPEQERERVRETLKGVLGGLHVHADICPVTGANGATHLIDWAGVTMLADSGTQGGVICVGSETGTASRANELRDPQDQLRLLLDEAEDVISMHDLDGRYVYFNGPERFGITESDVLGKTPIDLFSREQGEAALEQIRRVARTGETVRAESRLVWHGEEMWFSDLIFPVHGPERAITAVGRISRNATDVKRIEQEQSEQLRYFRSLIERASDIVLVIDADAAVRFASPSVRRVLGFSPGEIVGHHVSKFVPPEDLEDPLASFRLLVRRETEPVTSTMRVRHRDGTVRWLEATSSDYLDDPAVQGVVVNARDITDRHKAEEELRRSDEFHRTVLECLTDGVWMIDRDAVTTYVNPALERMLGYDRGEMIGRPLFDFMDDERRRVCEEKLASRRAGVSERHEFVFLRKSGEPVYVSMGTSPITDASGAFAGALAVVADVTQERREAEQREVLRRQLLQAQKMEAVGRLASGVAHDFNNYITAIMGYAEMAVARGGSGNPASEELEQVLSVAEKASELTKQLLIFSREQAVGDIETVDPNTLVSKLLKMLRHLIGEQIDIESTFEEGVWAIDADAGALEQVIVNLAVNARYAMPDGGVLSIGTRNVTVGERDSHEHPDASPGRHVAISVTDTGSGIEPDVLSKIFEPFFTTKEKGEGTGLGLATSYGIVKSLGGWIRATSSPRRGSTFTIYLPASSGTAVVAAAVERRTAPSGRGRRVLVIEDERIVRVFSATSLEAAGYEVEAAGTGADAAHIFRKSERLFDLVVCDMVLPDARGLDLVRAFCKARPGLKAVMATGYTDDPTARERTADEGHIFLAKPYSASDLAVAAAEALGLDAP
jgi:PAS domain S-box-containing protein